MRNENVLSVIVVCCMLAANLAGCTGEKKAGEGTPTAVQTTKSQQKVFFVMVDGAKVFDINTSMSEIIAPENRDKPEARQKNGKELKFSVYGLEEGDAKSFEWDFGDGTKETGLDVAHTYLSPGIFTATLTVTFNDGTVASRSITVYVNYHAEGKDKVSGIPCKGYEKQNGDEYWDYAFLVVEGVHNATIKTWADPDDSPAYPPLPVAGDNDVALEVYSPKGEVIGESDTGGSTGGKNPADETVKLGKNKLKDHGIYLARVGCFDGIAGRHHYANTGEVNYYFSIDVLYYVEEE